MGLNAFADKWKWLAINIMDHTLPRLQALLDKLSRAVDPFSDSFNILKHRTLPRFESLLDELSQAVVDPIAASLVRVKDHTLPRLETLLDRLSEAVDPVAARSLIKEMEAAIFVIKCTSALLFIVLFALAIIFLLYIFMKHRTQQMFHLNCVRSRYGGTVESMARTYANLIKFHSERVQRNGVGVGAERTHVFLIGAGETTTEAYLRCDQEFSSDEVLQSLLPPRGQSFVFRTIKDALHAIDDVCCSSASEKLLPKTLFILLLISTTHRDHHGHHEHETFEMPSSLRDHCYAIVGIGFGDDGGGVLPAHRLSKTSKGPNGELLVKSLPLGLKNAGVCFY
jgi:hypothetical protein